MPGEKVGEAFVTIRPDTQGFAADAQKGIAGPLQAALAGISTAVVGRKIGEFFRGAFDEATEAAKVGAQTAAVLKSTGEAAGVSAGHIEDLAGKLSDLAAIDDEVIQQGENVLLTFTSVRNEVGKGNNVFDRATTAALDMSAALGTDLQGSIIQVGKALQDPIAGLTALRRVGVNFTESQKSLIASLVQSGDLLGAQKVILDELAKEFGGAAASQATDAQKLSVAFGNLKESIGTALLPVVSALAKVLTPLATILSENKVAATALAIVISGSLLAAMVGYTVRMAQATVATLSFKSAQEAAGAEAAASSGRFSALLAVVGPYAAVAALAAGAVVGLHTAFTNANGDLTIYTHNLTKLTDAQLKNAAQVLLAEGDYDEFRDAVRRLADESEETARKLVFSADLTKKQRRELLDVIDKEVAANARAAAAAGVQAGAYDELGGSANTAADAIANLNTYTRAGIDDALSSEQAHLRLDQSIDALGTTLQETSADTLEGRAAVLDAKQAVDAYGDSVFASMKLAGKSTTDATNEEKYALGLVAGSLAPGSPLRQYLEEYIAKLGEIPGNIQTHIDALFTAALEGSPAGTFNVVSFGGGGTVDAPLGMAVPAVVHGGETVRTPEQEAALGASGAGGPTFIFNGPTPPDPVKFGVLAYRAGRIASELAGR